MLDPLQTGKLDQNRYLTDINESCLVRTLVRNKVAVKFEDRIRKDAVLHKRYFDAFPRLKTFYHEMNARIKRDTLDFGRVNSEFSENRLEFILIKSDGSFPHESDNIDVLIKPGKLGEAARSLRKIGYFEIAQVREPHKFLFRKRQALEELPLHIHTKVEWEGTEFVCSQDLWNRSGISDSGNMFCVPSPEDSIIITTAHLFFENHKITLSDLFKIDSMIRKHNIDWIYMLNHVRKLHWSGAFCLTMFLLNLVYNNLYGRSMLEQGVLSEIQGVSNSCIEVIERVMKPFNSGAEPLKIPYAVAALFFLDRIVRDSSLPFAKRFKHVGWVASDVPKRKRQARWNHCTDYPMEG